jgi:hypothetical protein
MVSTNVIIFYEKHNGWGNPYAVDGYYGFMYKKQRVAGFVL